MLRLFFQPNAVCQMHTSPRVSYPPYMLSTNPKSGHIVRCTLMTQSLQDFYNILRNTYSINLTYKPLLRIMMQYPLRANGTLDMRLLRGVSYDIMTI